MAKGVAPKSCPRCGSAMRLLGKTGSQPPARHWECVNRSLFAESTCAGYAMTNADAPLSEDDIARSMSAAEPRQEARRERLVAEADRLADRLSLRLGFEPGVYQYLSNGEHRTLTQAAAILDKLVSASQQARQTKKSANSQQPGEASDESRELAIESFEEFAEGCDRTLLLERCRALDRYLHYRRNKGANIEKAVDQLLWSGTETGTDRAWAALSYRVGYVCRYEMLGNLSLADFEKYFHDWRASRQVRAAIDRALGQTISNYFAG